MVKKSENPKKSLKISKFNFFSNKKSFEEKKILLKKQKIKINKCYPLSFPILGGRDLTRKNKN